MNYRKIYIYIWLGSALPQDYHNISSSKKTNIDPISLSKYRPISHLPLLSKILERIFSKQLIAHINKNNLFDPFQCDFVRSIRLKQLFSVLLTQYYLL